MIWESEFGKEYTDRNPKRTDQMNELYLSNFGETRTQMNIEFLDSLDRNIRILEVGCGVGVQLMLLAEMGFRNLYGIDVQKYAIEQAGNSLNVIVGSALDVPFKDGWFDIVFTSGLLIHLSPQEVVQAMTEIYRCTKRYIWGYEYYSPDLFEISYRGRNNMLWKGDYVTMFCAKFPKLILKKQKFLPYKNNANVDTMYLLEKA